MPCTRVDEFDTIIAHALIYNIYLAFMMHMAQSEPRDLLPRGDSQRPDVRALYAACAQCGRRARLLARSSVRSPQLNSKAVHQATVLTRFMSGFISTLISTVHSHAAHGSRLTTLTLTLNKPGRLDLSPHPPVIAAWLPAPWPQG